jgi:hypothetical protein
MKAKLLLYSRYKELYPKTATEDEIMEELIPLRRVAILMEEYSKEELTSFLKFLLDELYVDSDVYSEPPTAIDKYLHPELR